MGYLFKKRVQNYKYEIRLRASEGPEQSGTLKLDSISFLENHVFPSCLGIQESWH